MTADAVGGVWTYALDLAGGLVGRGVEVRLALLGPSLSEEQRGEAAAIDGVDLIETGLPLDWTAPDAEAVLDVGRALASVAREAGVDLVHLNSPALAAGAPFDRPVAAWCHSCVATWWSAVRGGPLPPDLAWRADLVRRGVRAADVLVAPSAAFGHATMAQYGLATPPLVVHNGRPRPSEPLPERGLEASGEPKSDVVLTAGRLWDEGKGVATLDRAAARIAAPVLAAGALVGPGGAAIPFRHIRALGMLPASDLARHLEARPIYASPARYEPFGLAVLEAAQAGCALVLSDIPSFRELWGRAAAFVPPGDDAMLARTVNALLGDRDRRDALGRAARERSRRYTAERMSDETLAVYRSLLSRRAAAA